MVYTRDNLVTYDLSGVIYSQTGCSVSNEPIADHVLPNGIPYMVIPYEDMQNKTVVSIDVSVTPHKPVFVDVPVPVTTEQLQNELATVKGTIDMLLSDVIPTLMNGGN